MITLNSTREKIHPSVGHTNDDMLIHIDNFKADLKALFKQYNVSVREIDNWGYNGEDEVFEGTDQYLVFGEEQYYVQTVEEIVRELISDSQYQ